MTIAMPPLPSGQWVDTQPPLSKREWFASLALQGILAGDIKQELDSRSITEYAVELADRMVLELERKEPGWTESDAV